MSKSLSTVSDDTWHWCVIVLYRIYVSPTQTYFQLFHLCRIHFFLGVSVSEVCCKKRKNSFSLSSFLSPQTRFTFQMFWLFSSSLGLLIRPTHGSIICTVGLKCMHFNQAALEDKSLAFFLHKKHICQDHGENDELMVQNGITATLLMMQCHKNHQSKTNNSFLAPRIYQKEINASEPLLLTQHPLQGECLMDTIMKE